MDVTQAFSIFRQNYDRVVSQLEEKFGIERGGEVAVAIPAALVERRVSPVLEPISRTPPPEAARALSPLGEEIIVHQAPLQATVVNLDKAQHIHLEQVAVDLDVVAREAEMREEAIRAQAAAKKCCCFPFFRR